jgi:hypothetical protein
MCLNKIVNEFEVPCPLNCGVRIKKGELKQHVEKYCPEKLFECAECGKQMKKDVFKYHIAREHQDTMFNKFLKSNNDREQMLLPETQASQSSTLLNRRAIPPGWTRWYMDPPIQWVGVPSNYNSAGELDRY